MVNHTKMKTLVVLTGPTGVGKTELSLSLAKLLSSPIISADSRQIYKGLPIGTAAPTQSQLDDVQHFFVGTLELDQYYSAAQFETDVMDLLPKLFVEHDFVLMCGGSMMYIDAVTKGLDDIPTITEDVRSEIQKRYNEEGLDSLVGELRVVDPKFYAIADLKNYKRIVHALEVFYMTGIPYSSFRTNTKKERPFNIVKLGLRRKRENLFNRINMRVDQMMNDGLLEEAKSVHHLSHLNSLNTVGYKEMFKYLDGEWELEMAIERMKKNTRVYAKKQMNWFGHDEDFHWFDIDDMKNEDLLCEVSDILGINNEGVRY